MSTLAYAQEYMGQPLNDLLQVFPDKLLEEVMVLERLPSNMIPHPNKDYFLGQDIAGMGKDLSCWEILDGTNTLFGFNCLYTTGSLYRRDLHSQVQANSQSLSRNQYTYTRIG